jgi:hypothetical protein
MGKQAVVWLINGNCSFVYQYLMKYKIGRRGCYLMGIGYALMEELKK